jgi:hypothetical protein
LAPVLKGLAGRLLTGPVAFAVAGFADIVLYAIRSGADRVKQRW